MTSLIHPGEYDVHLVRLPPVKKEELEGLVRNRLPVLYPGNSEEITLHYEPFQSDDGWRVLLFLVPKSLLREKPGGRLPIYAALKRINRKERLEIHLVSTDLYERYRFDAGVPIEVEILRTPPVIADGVDKTIVVRTGDSSWVPRSASGVSEIDSDSKTEIIDQKKLERARLPKTGIGFRTRRVGKRARVAIASLVACGALVLYIEVHIAESARLLDRQREIAQEIEAPETHIDSAEIDKIESTLAEIMAQTGSRPIRFLDAVEEILRGVGSVASLEFDRGTFRITSVTERPLEIMRRFAGDPRFSDVTPSRIEANESQRFTVIGVFIRDET